MPVFVERPDGLPPVNGFSHVVTATGTMIFISGQGAAGPGRHSSLMNSA
jgi:enamine deaminase RidA (YjgF/YER057c/UK114 family)